MEALGEDKASAFPRALKIGDAQVYQASPARKFGMGPYADLQPKAVELCFHLCGLRAPEETQSKPVLPQGLLDQ